MNRRVLAVLLVISAPILAGCGTLWEPNSSTESLETSKTIETSNATEPLTRPNNRVQVYGELPVNATQIWKSINRLFNQTYEAPTVVVAEENSMPSEVAATPFVTHLGLTDGVPSYGETRVGGQYSWFSGRATLVPGNGSTEEISQVLAHEYAHAIQHQSGFYTQVRSSETEQVYHELIEGSAVYVAESYAPNRTVYWSLEQHCERYRNGTPYERYASQAYCFGGQYFASTLESPSNLQNPDLRLPTTTEQLLHPNSSDLPTNLTVVDKTSASLNLVSNDRKGELFVRTVLGVELSEKRATEGAAGWGNDQLMKFTGDTNGYVWVLRWDTDADADEFESAFINYLNNRGNETTGGWIAEEKYYRLSTIDERTVVVVTGNKTFVESTELSKRGDNVTVSS